VDIQYFYKNNQHSYKHEFIVTRFANAIAQVIELPPTLEVCLYPLADNVYGGIDRMHVNRIGINYNLEFESIPKILAHELIHVSQKHLGHLLIKPNKMCYWHGIFYTNKQPEDMTYEEYHNLPWELDAYSRQTKVLQQALDIIASQT
jgi:hypothetical protein